MRWWRLVGAARWAGLWTDPGAVDARVQHTATFGLRWHPFAKAHLEVDYERRWQAAPNDGAAAQQVVAAQGDRVLGSVTVVF